MSLIIVFLRYGITGTTTRIKDLGVEEGTARLRVAARRVSSQLGPHDRFTTY